MYNSYPPVNPSFEWSACIKLMSFDIGQPDCNPYSNTF